jgi:hypothetical protein
MNASTVAALKTETLIASRVEDVYISDLSIEYAVPYRHFVVCQRPHDAVRENRSLGLFDEVALISDPPPRRRLLGRHTV